jgi:hypothetical protein
MLWQPPGERACDSCAAQRAPAPKLRRIHMSFVLRKQWLCTFMEEDLRTKAAPASKQAVEHAIMAGRGNVDLLLTQEQYERLVG